MDLQDPTARMSTTASSEQGAVYILDEPDVVREQDRRGRHRFAARMFDRAPDKPGIANLIEILAVVRGVEPERIEEEFAGHGYGDVQDRGRRGSRRLPGLDPRDP